MQVDEAKGDQPRAAAKQAGASNIGEAAAPKKVRKKARPPVDVQSDADDSTATAAENGSSQTVPDSVSSKPQAGSTDASGLCDQLPDPAEHNESLSIWSQSSRSADDRSHDPMATASIPSEELRRFMTFIVDRAGKSAVAIINTCAMDDHPYWRMMFECGMADAISEDPQMEAEFLERMVQRPGLPHAWKLVDYYLTRMPEDRKQKLFCDAPLRKRDHPASSCFYGASFMNSCGAHIMNVLKVMINHGMPIQPLIDRNFNELERATLLGHKPFIAQLAQAGAQFPDDLIRSVFVRAAKCDRDVDIIAMLMTEGGVPLSRFTNPKLLAQASKKAKCYLDSVAIRLGRIPQSEVDPEEEDATETA